MEGNSVIIPLPPPPYQLTTSADGVVNAAYNNSNNVFITNDLKKSLDAFKEFKEALFACMFYPLSCMLGYGLLLVFAPLSDLAAELNCPYWMFVLGAWLLSVPCLMSIYGVCYNKPFWLVPFIEIQLGGGFLLILAYVYLSIYDYINQSPAWIRYNQYNNKHSGVSVLFITVWYNTFWYLAINFIVLSSYWIALKGMLKYSNLICKKAVEMIGKGTSGVLADPMLMAELQNGIKN